MRHLRTDYAAIQPWPVQRPHIARVDGEVTTDIVVWDVPELGVSSMDRVQPLIPDDEPVFLLRGQDPAAHFVVRYYAAMAKTLGAAPELVAAVHGWAAEMAEYAEHAGHGAPDVPAGMLPDQAAPEPTADRWHAVVVDIDGFVLTDELVRAWCAAIDAGARGWAVPCETPESLAIVTGTSAPVPQSAAPDEDIMRMPGSWTTEDRFLEIELAGEETSTILRLWDRVRSTAAAMNALGVQ